MPLPPEYAFKRSLRAGFTLLELSIVLVIIGLLIGGIFVGTSLIHGAQLNAVITESNRYRTAMQAFQQQYQALPGDMNNATSFWGSAGGTGSDTTCATTLSTTTATCNGNGDGYIDPWTAPPGYEQFRAWQHLANAKMIEGSYTGTGNPPSATPNANPASPGINIPVSRYSQSVGWTIFPSFRALNAAWSTADYGTGHVLTLGAGGCGWLATCPALTPKDAWSIDKKLDDGKPATGNVISFLWAACTTAANLNDLTGTYNLNGTGAVCGLAFLPGF